MGTGLLRAQAYYGHRLITGTGLLQAQAYYGQRLITGTGLLCVQAYYWHRFVPKGAIEDNCPLIHNKCYVSRNRLSNASHATIHVSCIMVAEPKDSTKLLMIHDSEPGLSNFHPDNPSTCEVF